MLKEKINEDLRQAMKSGDTFTVGILRFINASLHNKAIEKRGKGQSEELTDAEVIEALQKEVKKRQDVLVLYKQGNRPELADKEEKEMAVIQKYLPAQMSREETEKVVAAILLKVTFNSFGEAMKVVMAELKGKADAKIISEIIKQAKPDL